MIVACFVGILFFLSHGMIRIDVLIGNFGDVSKALSRQSGVETHYLCVIGCRRQCGLASLLEEERGGLPQCTRNLP